MSYVLTQQRLTKWFGSCCNHRILQLSETHLTIYRIASSTIVALLDSNIKDLKTTGLEDSIFHKLNSQVVAISLLITSARGRQKHSSTQRHSRLWTEATRLFTHLGCMVFRISQGSIYSSTQRTTNSTISQETVLYGLLLWWAKTDKLMQQIIQIVATCCGEIWMRRVRIPEQVSWGHGWWAARQASRRSPTKQRKNRLLLNRLLMRTTA